MSKFYCRLGMKVALAAALLAVAGCANAPHDKNGDQVAENNDPMEPLNRAIFQFNYVVDGVVLKPVTQVYRGITPEKGQEMVSNAIDNIYTPLSVFNSILQGDPENAFVSFWRFMINSTLGIAGVFDVASEIPLKHRATDLGQTFAMYGAGPGDYIVLPIIGPSNTRDSFGRLGDALMNPFNYIDNGASIALWSATAVEKRSENMKLIDDIYASSLDPYATFRSGYTQKRAADVKRAKEARRKSQEKAGF